MLLTALLAASIALSGPTGQAPLPALKWPIAVIGHRAGRAIRPENTLAAIRNAIKLNADYVELDIRATRDGKLVIMHDNSVDRTTNGTGKVRDLDFDTIRSLDAGSKFSAEYAGEKVPTFAECLALCRGKVNIYVDHKEASTAQVLDEIKRYHMEKHVIIYNGTEGLLEWKRLDPNLPVMPSLPNSYRHAGGVAEFEKILPAEVLDGHFKEWTKDLVDEAHAAGVKVYVDIMGDTDNPEGYAKAIEMGVDGIQTDYPDHLTEYLRSRR